MISGTAIGSSTRIEHLALGQALAERGVTRLGGHVAQARR